MALIQESNSFSHILDIKDIVNIILKYVTLFDLKQLCLVNKLTNVIDEFPYECANDNIHHLFSLDDLLDDLYPTMKCALCFIPNTTVVKVDHTYYNVDHIIKHTLLLRNIRIFICIKHRKITDKVFENLKNLHTLNMSRCIYITDKAFENLKNLHTLDMNRCIQITITDKAFENLKNLHTLDMNYCYQTFITDKAFENLKNLHTLNMSQCHQETITDKAFENLKNLHTLDMSDCKQTTITDKAFENLTSLHTLDMCGCSQETITIKCKEELRKNICIFNDY